MKGPNFYEIFKKASTEHKQEPHVKAVGTYHVSQLTKCIRQSYYSHFLKTEYSDATKLIFRAGEEIHLQMKNAIKLEYPDAEFEVPCEVRLSKYKIQGHIDVVVPNQFAVEIKSTAWPKKQPDQFHVQQLNAYLVMQGLPIGYLVYVTKNTLIPVQFAIEKDNRLWKKMVQRAYKLHNHLLEKTVPEAEFWNLFNDEGSNWYCKNCFYRQECMKDLNLGNPKEFKIALNLHKKS